jgi:hypothetical protein
MISRQLGASASGVQPESIIKTAMKRLTSDQNGDVQKHAHEEERDCGESLSVFGEDPATHPMRLTQTMARPLSPASGQGTMPASGLQTVFSITHSDHSFMHARSSSITEMLTVSLQNLSQEMV